MIAGLPYFLGLLVSLPVLWVLRGHIDSDAAGLALAVPFVLCCWHYLRDPADPLQRHPGLSADIVGLFCLLAALALALCWQADELAHPLLDRHDLLTLPLFVWGAGLIWAGWPVLRQRWLLMLAALLAWPGLVDLLHRSIQDLLLTWSTGIAAVVLSVFDGRLWPVPGEPGMWWCEGRSGIQAMEIGASCSGGNALLALLLLALPLLDCARPRWWRATLWLLLAVLLVLLGNGLRLAGLAWHAASWGFDAGFDSLHDWLGYGIQTLVWLLLVALAWGMGIRPLPAQAAEAPRSSYPWWRCLLPVLFAVSCAWFLQRHDPRQALPKPDLPLLQLQVVGEEIAPPIPGYDYWPHRNLEWTSALFGSASRYERYVYRRNGEEAFFWVDIILSDSFEVFEQHTVLDCFRWHGQDVERAETGLIAGALPCRFFVINDDQERRWLVLTWIQLVELQGETRWRRISIVRRSHAEDDEEALAGAVMGLARSLTGLQ